MLIAAILVLAVGTYMIRLSGVVLRDRLELSDTLQRVLPMAAAASAGRLGDHRGPRWRVPPSRSGPPGRRHRRRLLAWRKAPFVVVVVAAAATAALLRLAGVP